MSTATTATDHKKGGFGFGSTTGFGSASISDTKAGGSFGSSSAAASSSIIGGFGTATGFGSVAQGNSSSGGGGFGSIAKEKEEATTAATAEPVSAFGTITGPGFSFAGNKAPPAAAAVVFPDSYKPETGEEDETCLLETKSKSFRLGVPTKSDAATNASAMATAVGVPATSSVSSSSTTTTDNTNTKDWIEVGIGPLRLLKKNNDHLRLVQRRECAHSVALNVPLYQQAQITRQEKFVKVVQPTLAHLLKFKLVEEAKQWEQLLQQEIPKTKSLFSESAKQQSQEVTQQNGSEEAHEEEDETKKESPPSTHTKGETQAPSSNERVQSNENNKAATDKKAAEEQS
jgi:hypothetical protein